MTSKVTARLACLAVLAMATAARAAKCTCEPPSEAAKAVGWWDESPPRSVPAREGDSDALTRELAMSETDLKAMLRENAVKNAVLLMFANLGAMQLLENYLCSLSEQGINRYLIYAMDVESHVAFQSRGWRSYFNPRLTETLNITKTTAAKQLKNHRPEFLTLMTAKLQIVQDVLRLGYDVLLTDVDIVFHKNVIPEVLEKCKHKDMCFMHDGQGRGRVAGKC